MVEKQVMVSVPSPFVASWADRSADCLTIISLSTQLLERPRRLSEHQQQRLVRERAQAQVWLQALEQEPHEL
jgi:hypothetical protein